MSGVAVPGAGAGGPVLDRVVAWVRPRTARAARVAAPLVVPASWLALVAVSLAAVALPGVRAVLVQLLWSGWLVVQVLVLLPSRSLPLRAVAQAALAGAAMAVPAAAATAALDGDSGAWAVTVWSAIWELGLPLVPVVLFLRGTARSRSAGVADVALVGAASGAGFQSVQDALARVAGTEPGAWALLRLLPGGVEGTGRAYAGVAIMTTLVAAGAALARRFGGRSWPAHLPRPFPVLLLLLVLADRIAWDGRSFLPGWLLRGHDLIGAGRIAAPLTLALLVCAVALDHRDLTRRAARLPHLPGERGNPFDVARLLAAAAPGGLPAVGHLDRFLRGRRRLAYGLHTRGPGVDPALATLGEDLAATRKRLAAALPDDPPEPPVPRPPPSHRALPVAGRPTPPATEGPTPPPPAPAAPAPGHPAGAGLAAGLESGFPAPAAGGRTAGPEGMPAAGTPVGLLAAVLDRVLRGVPAGIETRLLAWGTQGWRVDAHHLFHGGVGRDGRVRGFHHRGSAGAAAWARIVEGTRSAPDDLGVYRAVVEVQTGRGWVQATEPSAFFPDDWSRVQVLTAVRQALRGAEVDGTRWTGRTPEGVAVVGTLHADGTARAAPVYEDAA